MDITVDVDISGPLFRPGYPERVVAEYRDEVTLKVAGVGQSILHEHLHRLLRHPTGYYQSHIAIKRFAAAAVIHDSRVIYGWWLAGVGSRNFPVTKFKGYKHWPLTHQELEAKTPTIANHVLHQYVRRLQ